MSKNVIISPSMLAADMSNLDAELSRMKNENIDFLHYDVMDGIFVNNTSFDVKLLSEISKKFDFTYDVHLMIVDPKKTYKDYIDAGADYLTFHYEAMNSDEEVAELIDLIKKDGCKPGLSIKPGTNVEKITKFLKDLDLVLVMSVEPGFGGQKFCDSAIEKIRYLANYKIENNLHYLINVDGGINGETAPLVKDAGTDILVSGTYLFKSKNLKESIEKLNS